MQEGKSAMVCDATVMWPDLVNPEVSKIVGNVAAAKPPAGDKDQMGTSWFWPLGLGSASETLEAGWLWIEWATSKQACIWCMDEPGLILSPRVSTWKDPSIIAKYQEDFLDATNWVFDGNSSWPPFSEAWAKIDPDLSKNLQALTALSIGPKECMDKTQQQWIETLEKEGVLGTKAETVGGML